MKYILTLILAMAFFNMDAQNLQFSQVLTYSAQTYVANQDISIGTVPSGKVWKIESLNQVTHYCSYAVNGITLNNDMTTYTNNTFCTLPIWLKEQDNLSFRCSNGNSSYFVSIIEFTIVP